VTWKPISTAPTTGGDYVKPLQYGPWILLGRGPSRLRGRWRRELTRWDSQADRTVAGRWEGADGKPLPFDPQEWREVDG
jgi:hypothetical protein